MNELPVPFKMTLVQCSRIQKSRLRRNGAFFWILAGLAGHQPEAERSSRKRTGCECNSTMGRDNRQVKECGWDPAQHKCSKNGLVIFTYDMSMTRACRGTANLSAVSRPFSLTSLGHPAKMSLWYKTHVELL